MFNVKIISKIIYLVVTISFFCSVSYSQKMVYGYYPSWVETKLSTDNIDYEGLTHIIHAFIYPDSNGVLKGVDDLIQSNLVAKAHSEGVKVLVSVGGAPGSEFNPSEWFHTVANDPGKLDLFVNNISNFLLQYNYDGIDLDWEQPSNSDEKASLTKLVKALRAKFNETNSEWLLTMATFASAYFHQYFDYNKLVPEIDYFLVMSYNYTGWQNYTSHNTPLFAGINATDGTVNGTLKDLENTYKIPKEKIVMGTAFYGWQYDASSLRGSYTGKPTTIQYHEIDLLIKSGGWDYYWDDEVKAPYIIDTTNDKFITYDDTTSIKHKAEYIVGQDYAGMMIWALSYDLLPNGTQPLVTAIKNVFKYTSVKDYSEELKGYKLFANYPNPFNPSTKISFEIPERSYVELKVFNLTGEEVGKIFVGELEAGNYEKEFNASYLSSGIYYYRLTSGTVSLTKKMMLVK